MVFSPKVAALHAAILSTSILYAASDFSGARHEALLTHYQDETEQQVWSAEGKTWLSPWENWRLGIKALGEWVQPSEGRETGFSTGGHHNHGQTAQSNSPLLLDAISSASTRVTSDPDGRGRGEGAISLQRYLGNENPGSLGASIRYSGERDFHSVMTGLQGGVELFERNTALSANIGLGLDIANPDLIPPGELNRWPTETWRTVWGLQMGQLLTPRSRVGFSYSFTAIFGPQENPYRRALVNTTLFPEKLPQQRFRHVAGFEIGTYLGRGVALSHREGLYFDSWGVHALIPETAIPIEVGSRWLVTPRHRWFSQTAAPLYQVNYHSLTWDWYSGDPRLSRLQGNELAIEIEYDLLPISNSPSLCVSTTYSKWTDIHLGNSTQSWITSLSFRMPE